MDGLLDKEISTASLYALIITGCVGGTAAGVSLSDYVTDKKLSSLEERFEALGELKED